LLQTDLAHEGRKSRISAAAGRELAALSHSRGTPLHETAARTWKEERALEASGEASGWEMPAWAAEVSEKLSEVASKLPWPLTRGTVVD